MAAAGKPPAGFTGPQQLPIPGRFRSAGCVSNAGISAAAPFASPGADGNAAGFPSGSFISWGRISSCGSIRMSTAAASCGASIGFACHRYHCRIHVSCIVGFGAQSVAGLRAWIGSAVRLKV
ncbi:unnamed protein product [Symbiodinium sp. CCMP2456]|nr:unnamed protein product [Symbiodinium sp. CCMP2456]